MWSSGLQKAAHLFGLLSCRFVSSLNVLKTFGLLPLVSLCCLVASQDPRERMFPSSGACCSAGSSCHRALIPSSSVSPGLGSLQRALSRLASFPWHSRPRGTSLHPARRREGRSLCCRGGAQRSSLTAQPAPSPQSARGKRALQQAQEVISCAPAASSPIPCWFTPENLGGHCPALRSVRGEVASRVWGINYLTPDSVKTCQP